MSMMNNHNIITIIGIFAIISFPMFYTESSAQINNGQLFRLENIKQITAEEGSFRDIIWSPDGSKIAATNNKYKGIYIIHADGN